MKPLTETVVSTIDGSEPCQRLLVVLVQSPARGSHLELRQQSWGDGVGWFTQNRVELQTDQIAELRQALGRGGNAGTHPPVPGRWRVGARSETVATREPRTLPLPWIQAESA